MYRNLVQEIYHLEDKLFNHYIYNIYIYIYHKHSINRFVVRIVSIGYVIRRKRVIGHRNISSETSVNSFKILI